MTIGLVGQNQITTFTSPVNGTSPIDANVVRGNDNTSKTAFNTHDADATLHLQSSLASARPPAGVPGRKWLDSDTYRLYYDDGAVWHELAYIGGGGPATINGKLTVNGDVQAERNLIAQGPDNLATGVILANKVGTSTRWYLSTDGTPEGAADAGENLVLGAYSNAGTLIDQPIGIPRAAGGAILVTRPVTATGNISGRVFNSSVPPGFAGGLALQTNGVNRWLVTKDGNAESGGNAGSHFAITAFADDGTVIDSPVIIPRAAGSNITLNRPLAANAGLVPNVIIGVDPGGSAPLRVGGSIQIPVSGAYNIGPAAILAVSSGYTRLRAPDGVDGLAMGMAAPTGDPTNYYANDFHVFSNRASSVTYARVNSAGLSVGTDPGTGATIRTMGQVATAGVVKIGNTAAGLITIDTQVEHIILTGSAFGPAIRARWDGSTTNRYLLLGRIDNAGNWVPQVRLNSDAGDVIIGADPGGSALLRVNGSFTATTHYTFGSGNIAAINTASSPLPGGGNGATWTLPGLYGLLYIADALNTGNAALYFICNAIITIVYQNPANYFSNTLGTAGKINVAFSGGILTVQNLTGIGQAPRVIWLQAG